MMPVPFTFLSINRIYLRIQPYIYPYLSSVSKLYIDQFLPSQITDALNNLRHFVWIHFLYFFQIYLFL